MKFEEVAKNVGREQVYHIIFSTYLRKEILLNDELRAEVSKWVKEICREKSIDLYIYKVLTDHVHLLLKKRADQLLPQLMQLLKGNLTYKFFKQYPDFALDLQRKRLWTHGYYVVEIKDKLRFNETVNYIKNNKDRFKDDILALGFPPASA